MQLQPIVVGPDPGIGLPSGWPVTLMDAEDNVAVVVLKKTWLPSMVRTGCFDYLARTWAEIRGDGYHLEKQSGTQLPIVSSGSEDWVCFNSESLCFSSGTAH